MRIWRKSIGRALGVFGFALVSSAATPAWAQTAASPTSAAASAAAYTVLEKHCARCHQHGKLTRQAPASGLGNILHLDAVAATPHLVQPGNPDASRLYLMMLQRLMPVDAVGQASEPSGTIKPAASMPASAVPPDAIVSGAPNDTTGRAEHPTGAEIAAVRAWISSLAPPPACHDRKTITREDQAAALVALSRAAAASRSTLLPSKQRFLSIAHLHNACTPAETLSAYRQAIVRVVNSLSWKPQPIAVVPVDPAATLFRVNLDDLGWLPEHWERIMRSGPSPLGLAPPLPAKVLAPFGSAIPIARADWFAETVMTAPLYYDVLGLPAKANDIYTLLQLGGNEDLTSDEPLRASVNPSAFSRQPSLIERHGAKTGGFWRAYHGVAPSDTKQPASATVRPPSAPVPQTAIRTLFMLPNGLPAFFIVGPDGDRLDAVPPHVGSASLTGLRPMRSGQDCLSCHAAGPVTGDPASLPPTLATHMATDRETVATAVRRLGLDPDLTVNGVDPVEALAKTYVHPLDGARAAAEMFVPLETLASLANKDDQPASVLARRLLQGLVSRSEIERKGHELMTALNQSAPGSTEPNPATTAVNALPAPTAWPEHPDPAAGFVLVSDKTRYRKGDTLTLTVRASVDCRMTLISVDGLGRGTVIFPSDFETNPLLEAGKELKLPSPDAPYSFRLNETGRETVVALCNRGSGAVDGIRHDFERQRFTDLGDYAAHLARHATLDPNPVVEAVARPIENRQRGRRRPPPPEVVEPPARPSLISRTAISIAIEDPIPGTK